ncbi:hypothetical protein MUK42_27998 [Musa troglodytarum]|uniref:Thioredoxin superfamily protein n=1 Tax=Musa troglodytarum TaxID=320322 RepID=A0A9E7F8J4_9LILI|nr:hypothetical protein MUK42_27998 [Musa troglodytarum]
MRKRCKGKRRQERPGRDLPSQQHHSSRPPPPSWRQAFLPTTRKREEMTAEEGDKSFLERMLSHLRSTSKYYTGYPKDLGPSRIVHFTSERHFVQLLHEGSPVVVAFTIRCPYTKHLDQVLEEAAAEFYPHFKFVRFNYDVSVYGFREFFKRHGMNLPETK